MKRWRYALSLHKMQPLFCEECGDFALNIFGNHNCICPECHSTCDNDILGEIEADEEDEDE